MRNAAWPRRAMPKSGRSNGGRRVVILVQGSCKSEDILEKDDANTNFLMASGRWVEAMIPVNNGQVIFVASFYGLSGASLSNGMQRWGTHRVASGAVGPLVVRV